MKRSTASRSPIRPETAAAADFAPVAEDAEALRKAGIGAVLTHLPDGIARGTGTATLTDDDGLRIADLSVAENSNNKFNTVVLCNHFWC